MTNEQTFIFLKSIRERVLVALDSAIEAMPIEAQSTYKRHKSLPVFIVCVFCTPEKNPDHYIDVPYYPALDPLQSLLDSLDEDLAMLKASNKWEEKSA